MRHRNTFEILKVHHETRSHLLFCILDMQVVLKPIYLLDKERHSDRVLELYREYFSLRTEKYQTRRLTIFYYKDLIQLRFLMLAETALLSQLKHAR